jgi:DNA primase
MKQADDPKPWSIPIEHVEMVHRYELAGRLEFELVRIWPQFRSLYNGKTFPRHRGDDGALYWGCGPKWRGNPKRPLYRQGEALAALRDGRCLYFVEGERDADALVDLGFHATTAPWGASSFTQIQAQRLRRALKSKPEASIRIIADDDDAGRAHALAVYKALTPTADLRARVSCARPPNGAHDMAAAIADHREALDGWR